MIAKTMKKITTIYHSRKYMNKAEFNKRRDSLKELLDQIPVVTKPKKKQLTCYMFGAQHHERSNTWYIYNITTNNCIAGIKRFKEKSVIRYRAKSWWAPTLKAYKYDPLTLHAPSTTLGRWRNWLQKGVHQSISASDYFQLQARRNQERQLRRAQELDRQMNPPSSRVWTTSASDLIWSDFTEALEPPTPQRRPRFTDSDPRRDSNGRLRDSRGRFTRAPGHYVQAVATPDGPRYQEVYVDAGGYVDTREIPMNPRVFQEGTSVTASTGSSLSESSLNELIESIPETPHSISVEEMERIADETFNNPVLRETIELPEENQP